MKYLALLLFILPLAQCTEAQPRLVGGPCEGCEAVFEYGNEKLTPADTLPGFPKADTPLKITGRILKNDGITPAENIILYIYHTNEEGVYPTRGEEEGWGRRHGYLRGWINTGPDGQYTFFTRMPGSYSSNPAHIHATILEPDGKYYYINDYKFEGDPNLRSTRDDKPRGGSGIVRPQKIDGMLLVERDIILGKNVPGF